MKRTTPPPDPSFYFGDFEADDAYAEGDAAQPRSLFSTFTRRSTGTYLTWLADEFRGAGLKVEEFPGWKTRARSSGGYSDPKGPICVMWHHTASRAAAAQDAQFQAVGASAAPIANVNIARDGTVWILAAGATNTNGKGVRQTFSRGTVPADDMNRHAFGMEISNDGVGETYPQAQIDAAFTVSNIVNSVCSNLPTDVCTHSVYSPGRKIDPARAASVAGLWHPSGFNGATDSWTLADLRAECDRRAFSAPTPPPGPTPGPDPEPTPQPAPGKEIDMYLIGALGPNSPTDEANATPTIVRVGPDTITWESNSVAVGIDRWFGVPFKLAGEADVATLLNSRRATNALARQCSDPQSKYYCPTLAKAWRTT